METTNGIPSIIICTVIKQLNKHHYLAMNLTPPIHCVGIGYLTKSGLQIQPCVAVMAGSICGVIASYRKIKGAVTLGIFFYYNLLPEKTF